VHLVAGREAEGRAAVPLWGRLSVDLAAAAEQGRQRGVVVVLGGAHERGEAFLAGLVEEGVVMRQDEVQAALDEGVAAQARRGHLGCVVCCGAAIVPRCTVGVLGVPGEDDGRAEI
jgi:hypothetical protein